MQVRDFVGEHVADEYRSKFYQLMQEWDMSPNVYNSFYDMDVLFMKLDEAKEW